MKGQFEDYLETIRALDNFGADYEAALAQARNSRLSSDRIASESFKKTVVRVREEADVVQNVLIESRTILMRVKLEESIPSMVRPTSDVQELPLKELTKALLSRQAALRSLTDILIRHRADSRDRRLFEAGKREDEDRQRKRLASLQADKEAAAEIKKRKQNVMKKSAMLAGILGVGILGVTIMIGKPLLLPVAPIVSVTSFYIIRRMMSPIEKPPNLK